MGGNEVLPDVVKMEGNRVFLREMAANKQPFFQKTEYKFQVKLTVEVLFSWRLYTHTSHTVVLGTLMITMFTFRRRLNHIIQVA